MPSELDPALTFERFAEGSSNRVAATAARRAAESPHASYNPLILHAPAGLGKSHLLQAVGHRGLELHPESGLVYLELAEKGDWGDETVPVGEGAPLYLLFDDLQALARDLEGQLRLLRLWDQAGQAPRLQVIAAADRPPAEIEGLDERLLSRLGEGLTLDIQAPNPDLRLDIVHRRSLEDGIDLAPGVAEALAAVPFESVRELLDALARVAARQQESGERVGTGELSGLLGPFPRAASEGEFDAFLSDVASTLANLVEAGSWREPIAEAILKWEGEGIRTRALEETLVGDAPPPSGFLPGFEQRARELEAVRAEMDKVDPNALKLAALRDPDRLEEARELLEGARAERTPPPPPPARTLADFAALQHGDSPAARTAREVLAAPGSAYNPLFVHGPPGSGRTTFLGALGSAFLERRPDSRVGYLPLAERGALAGGVGWYRSYLEQELILVDDVELAGEQSDLSEGLSRLLEAVAGKGTQVVAASRLPPDELEGLPARLRGRLSAGLVVELAPVAPAATKSEPLAGATVLMDPDRMAADWLALDDRIAEEYV